MPNTLDVSTLHERPAAGRPTRAPEAHHDNATFASLAPPYAGIGEPRTGWEGYYAVHYAMIARRVERRDARRSSMDYNALKTPRIEGYQGKSPWILA